MKLGTCTGRLVSNVVGMAMSPRLLVEVEAHHTDQKVTGPSTQRRKIIRPPPLAE